MKLRPTLPLALIFAVAAGCIACERPTTPGFEGTWANSNPRFGSTLHFRARDDGGYDIRYDVERPEVNFRILCPWGGPCQEYGEGELVALWEIESWIDADSGLPRLKSSRRLVDPESKKGRIWSMDEFELGQDGLTMTASTCAKHDIVYAADHRPQRSFHKLSDRAREPIAQ